MQTKLNCFLSSIFRSCPILGCGNLKSIARDDLHDDEEYARKLQHQRSSQADPLAL